MSTRDCQNGCAPEVAILWNPRPRTPEVEPCNSLLETSETTPTNYVVNFEDFKEIRLEFHTEHLILYFKAREPDYVFPKYTVCGSTTVAD